MIFSYLYHLRRPAALFGFFFALFAVVALLYDLPPEAVGYLLVLFAVPLVICLAVDFVAFSRRHRRFSAICRSEDRDGEQLPAPRDLPERDYDALLRALEQDREATRAALRERRRESEFYYTLWTHQIKTPIAAMRLLLERADTPDGRALRDELFEIERYTEMALSFLRCDSESNDFVFARCDLDEIVRDAVRQYAPRFVRKRLTLDFPPLGVCVLTDRKWLTFVVAQVLSNALQYTASGGVSIALEAPATLVISDTGAGIRPEDLPRIFEKGYTGFTGHLDGRSSGIGLYLCRRIFRKLGHTISISSEPGRGTQVRLGLDSAALTTE